MLFVFISILSLYSLRKLGWFISKNGLYGSHIVTVVVICFLWGLAISYLLHTLVQWQNPNIIVKIIFGYGVGAYVSTPNYGLVSESFVPQEKKSRHLLISLLPFVVFILTSVAFAFV